MKKKFRNIKIRGFRRLEAGIFLKSGKNWVLLRDNPVDFVIDGYLLVRKKYILREEHPDSAELSDVIMNLKGEYAKTSDFSFPIDQDELLFQQFLAAKTLIQICLHNQDSTLVGRVVSGGPESFRMRLLSRKGKWLNEFNFQYAKLRTINIGSDYLKSFQLLTDEVN